MYSKVTAKERQSDFALATDENCFTINCFWNTYTHNSYQYTQGNAQTKSIVSLVM